MESIEEAKKRDDRETRVMRWSCGAAVLLLLVGGLACSSSRKTTVNQVSPPGGEIIRDTTPYAVPRDPDAPVWSSRTPAPDWLASRASISSQDRVVGHSSKVPGREAAYSMAFAAALREAAFQISSDVTAALEKTDSAGSGSLPSGEMRGTSDVALREKITAIAHDSLVGARVEDEYYERFWSAQAGWAWKAHVLLKYDYQRSMSATMERATRP